MITFLRMCSPNDLVTPLKGTRSAETGVDSAWEQRKLEARKMRENAQSPSVRCSRCWALFLCNFQRHAYQAFSLSLICWFIISNKYIETIGKIKINKITVIQFGDPDIFFSRYGEPNASIVCR